MSRVPCPIDGCDHPARSGYMCGGCQAELARALDAVPEAVAELETTLAKQHTRTGGGGGDIEDDPAPAVLHIGPLPYDARASEAAWVLRNALVGWVRALHVEPREGPVCATCTHPSCRMLPYSRGPADTCQGMAAWLSAGLQRLVRHPAAEEAHGEIVAAVAAAERVVDRPADRWYAGPCADCTTPLYVKPGVTAGTCRECGQEFQVADRWDWMREQCKDLLGSPSYVAMVCTGLGAVVSPSTVRVWISRKKIHPRHFVRPIKDDGDLRPLYRVGDVLKRVLGEDEAYSA